jgi:hypothetical protein
MKDLLAIGLVLDPRYKMRYLRYQLEQQSLSATNVEAFLGKVRSTFLILWDKFVPSSSANSKPAMQPTSKELDQTIDEDTTAFLQYMARSMGGAQLNAPGAELDLYLKERNVIATSNKDFDILGWWKTNALQFPSLSKLACAILMIPMTLVASESAFSTGGRVLDDHRMRLNDDSVEALLCTQDWIMASNRTG